MRSPIRFPRLLLRGLAFAVALVPAPLALAASIPRTQAPPAPASTKSKADPWLVACSAGLEAARAAAKAGDRAGARRDIADAIERALAGVESRNDGATRGALESLAGFAVDLGAVEPALRARRKALELAERGLAADHLELQIYRMKLGSTLVLAGDLRGARPLLEQAAEVGARTMPADSPWLRAIRANLAVVVKGAGDLTRARALEEEVLAACERTLKPDHPELLGARQNLALTIKSLGDLEGALPLEEQVLAARERASPADSRDLQIARTNLATTLATLGQLERARELHELAHAVFARTLPDDHADLQAARQNLGAILLTLRDLQAARGLFERVLEIGSREWADDHPALQAARLNLAATLRGLGEAVAAQALEEKVLAVRERTLPGDHPDLQLVRASLATTKRSLGDLAGARELEQSALEALTRTLPEDHPQVLTLQREHARTLRALGELRAAATLEESILAQRERTLPEEHPDLIAAHHDLAATLLMLAGDDAGDPEARSTRARAATLLQAAVRSQIRSARRARSESPRREATERCARIDAELALPLSAALGTGALIAQPELAEPVFELAEATRSAALAVGVLARAAATTPTGDELAARVRATTTALARAAQRGTTTAELARLLAERESAERELLALTRAVAALVDVDARRLGATLGRDDVLVAYRRLPAWRPVPIAPGAPMPVPAEVNVDGLCAFVLRAGGDRESPLALVDLGPLEPIERAVQAWRAAVGAGAGDRGVAARPHATAEERDRARGAGETLRALVLDAVLAAAPDARRLVLVLDDVLHLVPFDALPLPPAEDGAAAALVGERFVVEVRSTTDELLLPPRPPSDAKLLLALGDAAYGAEPFGMAGPPEDPGPARTPQPGFEELPATSAEVGALPALHAEAFWTAGAPTLCSILERSAASIENLVGHAPAARWLHVATHGWYDAVSIPSWSDREPLDARTGLGLRPSGAEQVRLASPMLLAGLAFAGANLPPDAQGRVTGRLTAEELSTIDLSRCEMAVLSACDTGRGASRSSQGVASLQQALQLAGVRSAVTSLWKVPDAATKDLMVAFYRRVWVEKKPKARALWEAKMELRRARDASGEPRYATRDWAGWVLTGDPR
jgi:tetratricopeptide (TPR) repeat protein